MLKYCLYKIGQFFLYSLPLRQSYKIAAFISNIQYYFSRRDKLAINNNLRRILPEVQDLSVLTRQVFQNFGRYLIEFFQMQKVLDKDYIKNNVKIENIEYLEQALEAGKGGIILTAHIGNWEMGAAIISLLGYPISAIALTHKENSINALFDHQRQCKGVKVIAMDNMAGRRCLERLRSNEFVAIVGDRDFGSKGGVLSFFGCPTRIPKGPAVFSLKTGAPIIPIFLIRDSDKDSFILSICKPIVSSQFINSRMVKKDNIYDIMKKYIIIIEEKIKKYPDQWIMFREFGVEVRGVG